MIGLAGAIGAAIFRFDANAAFTGLTSGLTIGLLALGIVLVYRSNRVINFAYGEVGVFGAVLLAMLVVKYHWNYWPALGIAVVAGALLSLVIELSVIRRLFDAPRVVVFVATIGIALLVRVATIALPDIGPGEARGGFPTPWFVLPSRANPNPQYSLFGLKVPFTVGDVAVQSRHLMALLIIPLLVVALVWFMQRTLYGLCIQASAANADAARLAGVRPRRMSSIVWTIAGALAVMTVVIIMPLQGITPGPVVEVAGPDVLLRALAAALVGAMVSMPRAFVAGVALGVVEELLRFNVAADRVILDSPGVYFVLLFLLVLAFVLGPARRGGRGETEGRFSFSPRLRPTPAAVADLRVVRRAPIIGGAVVVAVAIALPALLSLSELDIIATALAIAMIGLSVTLLTGWAGQLSLGQFAIAGVGALTTATLQQRGLPTGGTRLWPSGMPYWSAVVVAVGVCVVLALVIGAPALRVRGLFLAVTTLAFAVMCDQWLYTRPLFIPEGQQSVPVDPGRIGPIELRSHTAMYYAALLFLVAAVLLMQRVRRGGIGRSLIGVRDNETSAAAYTVSPTRAKLTAFALSGAFAGLAGAILAGIRQNVNPEGFGVTASLDVVAMTIVGGVGSVAGPVVGALWVHGLPAFTSFSDQVNLVRGGLGLLIMLMYFPGGLVQIGAAIREALYGWLARRLPAATGKTAPERSVAAVARSSKQTDTAPAGSVLTTSGVTVRFGGRVAVDGVDLRVGTNEVVGLIGTNGAGKSTLMNAIGGFVPSSGAVHLLGEPIAQLTATQRARRGLGRTFQSAELFSDLTVAETVMVALEARGRTPLTPTLLALPSYRRQERRRRAEAADLVDFLGLGRYANAFISDLSTGTRRICEMACLLALDARVLCLDEPTAGVAQRETEAFGPLIRRIQAELGASLLVIEHDMPLIMSISDRVYCLEAGQVIAQGAPFEVRNNPLVIASYLGTDTRAIERSNVT